jgi:hypothetical protein
LSRCQVRIKSKFDRSLASFGLTFGPNSNVEVLAAPPELEKIDDKPLKVNSFAEVIDGTDKIGKFLKGIF